MPTIADLPLWIRTTLRLYPWRKIDPVPSATLRRPLTDARVALVTSAGIVAPGQPPFDEGKRGGDPSYRILTRDVRLAELGEFHRSRAFDHTGIAADRNLALPLDRLTELAAKGVIGEVAPRHLSFMGSITAPARLTRESAPAAAQLLVDDHVDVALLVPV